MYLFFSDKNCESINTYAFAGSSKLEKVGFEQGHKCSYIGPYVFNSCSLLVEVDFAGGYNWGISSSVGGTVTAIPNTYDLSDKAVASTLLRSTYAKRYWYKNVA